MKYFGHYPSLELQALAFIEQAKLRKNEIQFTDTEWNVLICTENGPTFGGFLH
jgi:hypothetical protein